MLRRAGAGLAAAALCLATSSGCTGGSAAAAPPGPAPALVVAGPAAPAWQRLLRVSGAAAVTGGVGDLPAARVAVVPAAARLSPAQAGRVTAWVRSGGRLVTAAPVLLGRLGVGRGAAVRVAGVREQGVDQPVTWASPVSLRPVRGAGLHPLATADGGVVVAGTRDVGRGSVLALAVDPLAGGRDGHELLPGLGRTVAGWGAALAGAARPGVEVYLDPGVLPAADRDPGRLAARLGGVRAVHLAAWDVFDDPRDDYPYADLLSDLHARGVLVYAWLEPPFVDLAMWVHHPECREKTDTGADARVDWRSLVALEDPRCFDLAWQRWQSVLERFAWDGVDVAELYFEPGDPPVTPYSPAALRQFGRDPKADPAGFLRFRTRLATRLNDELLHRLNGLPGAAGLDLVLTVIDDSLDPSLALRVGHDDAALAAVAASNGAGLQLEDPFSQWSAGPLRYRTVDAHLARLAAADAGILDLNVVQRPGARPTARMTGAELDLAVDAAGARTGRVMVYAVGTVPDADLARVPTALGAAATVTARSVDAPWTVVVTAPPGGPSAGLSVDGVAWPVSGGRAYVPAGRHALRWTDRAAGPGLRRFTGELASAATSPGTLRLSYTSRAPAYAVVDARPDAVRLDGVVLGTATVYPDPDGGWTVRLPRGRHDVLLTSAG